MEKVNPDPRFSPPQQDRSRRTMDRIAEAALSLMEEEGAEAATVAAIVERADASIGSFYARFPTKEDLFRYLEDRVWTEARERWDEALAGESWEGRSMTEVVEGVVGLLLRSFQADYHRRRVLGTRASVEPGKNLQRREFHRHLLETVTPLLMAREDEIQHPDPEAAIAFGYHLVIGGIREMMEAGEEGWKPAPGPELARAWKAYLSPGWDLDTAADGEVVDFFDPWG